MKLFAAAAPLLAARFAEEGCHEHPGDILDRRGFTLAAAVR